MSACKEFRQLKLRAKEEVHQKLSNDSVHKEKRDTFEVKKIASSSSLFRSEDADSDHFELLDEALKC